MGLFDQVLNAINDPNRQASQDQVGHLINAVQGLSQQTNTNSDTMNQAVSVLGGFVRSALQEKRANQGDAAAQELVRQGSQSGGSVLTQLFNQQQQQQLTETLSQRTGLNSGQIQMMLPLLIPVVMRLLQSGQSTQPGQTNNNILSTFLDADGDGDVDMGDMLRQASRYVG